MRALWPSAAKSGGRRTWRVNELAKRQHMDMDGANVPREAILSASLDDGTVDDVARALVELVHARVDAAGDVERRGSVEVVAN